MARLLTLKEIAKELEVPESSLRKYREIFSPFIPSVGTGRSRRYRAEAKEVLKDIREMREEMHMPWDAISEQLGEKYPIDGTPPQDDMRQQCPPPFTPQAQQPPVANQQDAMQFPLPAPQQNMQQSLQQQQQSVATMAGGYLKKMAAMSEKQMMIINAMALELMSSIEDIRAEARAETEKIQRSMNRAIEGLASNVATLSRQERALLREIQGKLDSVDKSINRITANATPSNEADIDRVKKSVKAVQQKLKQREQTLQEYKKSFEILKKENSELREFKQRHLDSAEDRIREVKASKHSSTFKRILGFKP